MASSIDPDYATLGGLLLAPAELAGVAGWLRAEDFARPVCGEVYQVIVDMRTRQLPVDPVTVLGELRGLGRVRADGYPAGELVAMVEAVPVPAATSHYARIVLAAAVFRQVEACGARFRQIGRRARGTPEDAFDSVAQSWDRLIDLRGRWRLATDPAGEPVRDRGPGRRDLVMTPTRTTMTR